MPASFLSPALLLSPPHRAVRVIGLDRLQRMLEQAARVEVRVRGAPRHASRSSLDPEATDPDAVHDFRVALRRLRTWLQAFRPYLADTLGRHPMRRLRRLSRLAGRARDLEVALSRLSAPRSTYSGPGKVAADWLATRTGRELASSRKALVYGLQRALPEAGAELTRALWRYSDDVVLEKPVSKPMVVAMAEVLRHAAETLEEHLGPIRCVEQVAEAHGARIVVKRLRYLLEALGPPDPDASAFLPRLITLQHLFGELHDAQMLEQRLRRARAAGKSGRKRASAGRPDDVALEALGVVLARRISTAYAKVERAIRARATRSMLRQLGTHRGRLPGVMVPPRNEESLSGASAALQQQVAMLPGPRARIHIEEEP